MVPGTWSVPSFDWVSRRPPWAACSHGGPHFWTGRSKVPGVSFKSEQDPTGDHEGPCQHPSFWKKGCNARQGVWLLWSELNGSCFSRDQRQKPTPLSSRHGVGWGRDSSIGGQPQPRMGQQASLKILLLPRKGDLQPRQPWSAWAPALSRTGPGGRLASRKAGPDLVT